MPTTTLEIENSKAIHGYCLLLLRMGSIWFALPIAEGSRARDYAYRLTIRPAKPDFQLRLEGDNPSIAAGSGKAITFKADRFDYFEGEIRIHIEGLPPGFSVASPLTIEAGHSEAQAVINAGASATNPTKEQLQKIKITATSLIEGQQISHTINGLSNIRLGGKPKMIVHLEPAEVTLAPGQTVVAKLRVERNGFDDRMQIDVANLPHGVIVDNIGLNGILIRKGETEREIFLNARNWVPETDRTFFAITKGVGNQCSLPITLRVRKKSPSGN